MRAITRSLGPEKGEETPVAHQAGGRRDNVAASIPGDPGWPASTPPSRGARSLLVRTLRSLLRPPFTMLLTVAVSQMTICTDC